MRLCCNCFFCNDTAPTEIYTLSLHDALPIFHELLAVAENQVPQVHDGFDVWRIPLTRLGVHGLLKLFDRLRSEEHTSELQSRLHLVCRLLLEKKKARGLRASSLARRSRLWPS